jgi:DNA polymerase-3 subunit delta
VQLWPDKLGQHLQKQLVPVYLVSGDEPLLVQECCDQIRAKARADGCVERQIIEGGVAKFDWSELLHGATEMSLFAERKLIELRLPSGKPGAEGSKAINQYLEVSSGEDVLLLVLGKVDKQSQNSKWYKALDKAGVTIQVWPVKAEELPRWMQQRLKAAGLEIDRDALQLLCDRIEGNLLAAVQEIEKLKLLAQNNHITTDTVTSSVSDNARYNVFGMADNALKGDATVSLRMLQGLRSEGTEPTVALWALAREIRTLYEVQMDCDEGKSAQQALQARKVWNTRMPLMQAALSRHDSQSLYDLVEQAAMVDGSIKGYAKGSPWDKLERLVASLCKVQTAVRYPSGSF